MEDAVYDSGGGLFVVAVVALHEAGRRAHEDLAVIGNRHLVFGTDRHRVEVVADAQRDARARFGETVSQAHADATAAYGIEQVVGAVGRSHEHERELVVERVARSQEFQQLRDNRDRRRPERGEISSVVAWSATERNCGSARKPPEQSAHESENV